MTRTPTNDQAHASADSLGSDPDAYAGHGRHGAAVALLEAAVEPIIEDLGYELLLLEWLGSGKRRLMRLYIDSPAGVSIEDCARIGRILSNALDAREAAAAGAEGATDDELGSDSRPSEPSDPVNPVDPALAALLGKPYVLEVSSPGVDRPLTRRRHFAAHVGGKVKLETWGPIQADLNQKNFHGRIVAVEEDPAAPEDQRRGIIVVHDADGDRTLRIPLPRVRRANLVWEG
jgi:ribosome maturation factor RimP